MEKIGEVLTIKNIARSIVALIIITLIPTLYGIANMPGNVIMKIIKPEKNFFQKLTRAFSPRLMYTKIIISMISWVIIIKTIGFLDIDKYVIFKDINTDRTMLLELIKVEEEVNMDEE